MVVRKEALSKIVGDMYMEGATNSEVIIALAREIDKRLRELEELILSQYK